MDYKSKVKEKLNKFRQGVYTAADNLYYNSGRAIKEVNEYIHSLKSPKKGKPKEEEIYNMLSKVAKLREEEYKKKKRSSNA